MTHTVYRYTDIITSLQTITPEVHIAGGAVRDTILEKPIHDIDIFIDDYHVEEAAKLLRADFAYIKTGEWKQYLGFSDPAMTRVAKFESYCQEIPLCIIGLKSKYTSPEANISRFDFGICMAAFDGENEIRSPEFSTDAENKTFTLLRADNIEQFNYSMSRYAKISAGRCNGWELKISNEFEEYARDHTFRRYWYEDDSGNYARKGFSGGESLLKPKERVTIMKPRKPFATREQRTAWQAQCARFATQRMLRRLMKQLSRQLREPVPPGQDRLAAEYRRARAAHVKTLQWERESATSCQLADDLQMDLALVN